MSTHTFIDALTSEGYYTFLSNLRNEGNTLYILSGSYGLFPYQLLQELSEDKDESIEYFHSFYYPDYYKGIRFKKEKVAIIYTGIKQHEVGVGKSIISLSSCINPNRLRLSIAREIKEKQKHELKCCHYLQEAKEIHFKRESLSKQAMDFQKADELVEKVIGEVFEQGIAKEHSQITTRFFGAFTTKGPINFIDSLTKSMEKRYILHGGAGSGKSTFMKKIIEIAKNNQESITIFPCSFDPQSIDMVLLEDRKIAFIDGTNPHPLSKGRERDEIIDMTAQCMNLNIRQQQQSEIERLTTDYQEKISLSKSHLYKASVYKQKIDEAYDYALIKKEYNQVKELLNQWI